jgi:SAM-dependent methyltransferase
VLAYSGVTMSDRLTRERAFHEARFAPDSAPRSADRFYVINRRSDRFFRQEIEATPAGGRILDYGCGDAAYVALHAAHHGYRASAIDISPVAIERAHAKAVALGVDHLIDFHVMDAEHLAFDDHDFDLVCGLGVIHHLDLDSSLRECARLVRPGGRAVFVEPLGHNPIINLYRRRTPEQRSADEHPLTMSDVDVVRRYFRNVETTYFHLMGLLALPLHGRGRFEPTLKGLDALDRLLFKTPVRRYAWMVGMRLSNG